MPCASRGNGDIFLMDEDGRKGVELLVPWKTIFKVLAAILLAYVAVLLWPFFKLIFVSILIAITLHPALAWTERHGWPRWLGITIASVGMFGVVIFVLATVIPALFTQGTTLVENLPAMRDDILQRIPKGAIRKVIERIMENQYVSDPTPLLKNMVTWGRMAFEGVIELFIILILSIYLLLDGPDVYAWLIAFVPKSHREKAAAASSEISTVVFDYVAGQVITSVLCAAYAFIVLMALGVPDALLLAVLAGIFDILPIIGFFLATIPAMLLALTVSPTRALLVLLLYTLYHIIENYYIVPKVYGDKLRLTTLSVLLSLMAAALLGGVVGAIVVLPIVASYPIIEKIWLSDRLQRDTVRKHSELDAEKEQKTE